MFHRELNINGIQYKLAVNISGKGAPTSSTEADVGMFYMDENNGEVYKRTPNGWVLFTTGGGGGTSIDISTIALDGGRPSDRT